jgi:demethylmenaquinone methyltransferase / 2-methoxy-6-polyprenyl-1,4-benzoquinol methylase
VPNKYLSYDGERALKVREMFTRIAGRYDLVNDVMSFGLHRLWKRQTVALALDGRGRSPRVLDLCCGTGDMAFLSERTTSARVVGIDFTLPMLVIARRRKQAARSRAVFVQGDALCLPLADGCVDAITIGYGLRNIAEPKSALSEMRRVLAPGGRLVVLDFGKPANPVARTLYMVYLRTVMPAMGWIFHGDPQTYSYIPDSLERYPAQRGVEQWMREAGFARVRYENRLLGTMGLNIGEVAPPEQ